MKPVIRDDPKEIVPGKVYTCGHCNKKVFGKESMKRHIASHRDGTIIQCALCCDFFVSNASFTAHRKSAHPSLNNLVSCLVLNVTYSLSQSFSFNN